LKKRLIYVKIKARVEVAIVSTIKDIAKAAGVSIATVSIVLNGKGRERKISQETQQRIYKIAQDLNYVPNQSAKKLRSAKKDSCG
jgi:LacI family transcriptional regulator, purine nucleotide synthesis repressor